jgi:hypothetical protein
LPNDIRERVRRTPTDHLNAVVRVETAGATHEMRLLDLLRTCVDEPELFEELSAMTVGQTVEMDRGRTRVQRLR